MSIARTEKFEPAYFFVWPDEADILKTADFKGVAALVRRLKLGPQEKKPIKVFLPEALVDALAYAATFGEKKKDVLLAAAREFRRQFPQSQSLMRRPPSIENYEKGERMSWVLRLVPDERQLLEEIGRGHPKIGNRYDAFMEMAKIIRKMDFEDKSNRKRITVYVPIPAELDKALDAQHEKTKAPRARILLEALRKREENRRT